MALSTILAPIDTKDLLKHSAYFATLKVILLSALIPLCVLAGSPFSFAFTLLFGKYGSNVFLILIDALVWGIFRASQIKYTSIAKSPTSLISLLVILSGFILIVDQLLSILSFISFSLSLSNIEQLATMIDSIAEKVDLLSSVRFYPFCVAIIFIGIPIITLLTIMRYIPLLILLRAGYLLLKKYFV